MTVPPPNLRALSVGEILDKAFRLYRANFWLFIGITAFSAVLKFGVQLVDQTFSMFIVFLDLLFVTLAGGALTWAASRAYMRQAASTWDAYHACVRRILSFLGAYVLALVLVGGVVVLGIGLASIINWLELGPLNWMTFLFVFIWISFLTARWAVLFPCILLEDLGGLPALDRSWALTSRDKWHVYGSYVSSILLVFLVAQLPSFLIVGVASGLLSASLPVFSIIVSVLSELITLPLGASIIVILYYDLRVRREGYDLELAMQGPEPEPAG